MKSRSTREDLEEEVRTLREALAVRGAKEKAATDDREETFQRGREVAAF